MTPDMAEGGSPGSAHPPVDSPPQKRLRPALDGSARDRQPEGHRVDRATWAGAVARQPLGLAARLVAGRLVDRATRDGRVRVTAAELAAFCCLSVRQTADALATLGSYQLVARDDRHLVLTDPGREAGR
jgi:hypothetical protein